MTCRALLLVMLLCMATVMPDPSLAGDARLTLVYTGRLDGEIEPCGCTVGSDLGGIRRLASVIDALREESPDLTLLGTGGILGDSLPAHRVSNAFLLEGVEHLDYDAIGLQWDDLIYGTVALREPPLPWVASNWRTNEFDRVRVIDRGGLRLAYLQWLAPGLSPYGRLPTGQQRVFSDMAMLSRQLRELQRQGIVTALGAFGLQAPLQVLPLNLIDVLVLPEAQELYGAPVRHGKTWVLRPGSRGQRVARLELRRGDDGLWVMHAHRVIELDDTIDDAARLEGWYERYTNALADDYRQRVARASANQADGSFIGAQACAACHEKQFTHWSATDHAQALSSLQQVGKEFDANCVQCHSVGFGRVGGFYSAREEPDLRDVACEACHGPAKAHVRSGGDAPLIPVSGQLCRGCHDESHSPGFDLRTGWSRIEH